MCSRVIETVCWVLALACPLLLRERRKGQVAKLELCACWLMIARLVQLLARGFSVQVTWALLRCRVVGQGLAWRWRATAGGYGCC